ncbi:C6 transcription factor, putative [Talaromyces stipitatus ATCC 10500]|uniref:C6 transcription factor, putative n=1 Tax=Talaromyces stipitatus (strain ATCC 10500 / CBS 375.48 / QM 6759 / NRRL 1006) TaxID=441959 RepID=B8MS64_TALSN|nr:C6 transcription factor, putative [Talaromyces stipitatus ATCC 10500]EED12122.1 C6 transcription factor, putative [Talaromyces stipitatus ATCC 10500]
MARRCSLSPRVPVPGTDTIPDDAPPNEIPDHLIEELALRAFFHDYCVIPVNPALSRGFLARLEPMVHRLGLQSPVANACKAVAFACHGLKLSRPFLTQKAETLYHELLGFLARSIQNCAATAGPEMFVIAILMGLYEMIMAGETDPGHHNAHAGGLAAILQIENSPRGLLHAARSGHPLVVNPMLQNKGIFTGPSPGGDSQDLDAILVKTASLWQKSETFLSNPFCPLFFDQLYGLKQEATALYRDLIGWQTTQVEDIKPTTIGYVRPSPGELSPGVGCWPGRIDTYVDLYVAGVWNVSRVARCFLIHLLQKLSNILDATENDSRYYEDVVEVFNDILASIPYHLTEDSRSFLAHGAASSEITNPGRPVGGLLLLHPIYVVSQLPIVPADMQEYLRRCMAWIGTHMGIGQACLLAKAPHIEGQYFACGCMIVCAGLLV